MKKASCLDGLQLKMLAMSGKIKSSKSSVVPWREILSGIMCSLFVQFVGCRQFGLQRRVKKGRRFLRRYPNHDKVMNIDVVLVLENSLMVMPKAMLTGNCRRVQAKGILLL